MSEDKEFNKKELFEQTIDLFLISVKMRLWTEYLAICINDDSELYLSNEKMKEAEYIIDKKVQKLNDKIRNGIDETKRY